MGDIKGLLGLAARSRSLVSGEDACLRGIRDGKVRLLVLAVDAGANGAKKMRDKCAFYHVPIIAPLTSEELGKSIGKSARAVVGVTSSGFAAQIQRVLPDQNGGEPI